MDDGPPSREFLDEDYDEDNEAVADDEPLSLRAQRLKAHVAHTVSSPNNPNSALPQDILSASDTQIPH